MMQAKNTRGKRQQMQETSICFSFLFSPPVSSFLLYSSNTSQVVIQNLARDRRQREGERERDAISYVHVKKQVPHTGNKTYTANTSLTYRKKSVV